LNQAPTTLEQPKNATDERSKGSIMTGYHRSEKNGLPDSVGSFNTLTKKPGQHRSFVVISIPQIAGRRRGTHYLGSVAPIRGALHRIIDPAEIGNGLFLTKFSRIFVCKWWQ
jgi:hypothetical protein